MLRLIGRRFRSRTRNLLQPEPCGLLAALLLEKNDPGRTRTCNPRLRRPMPYPLGHGATCQISYWVPVKLSLLRPFARLAPANARHYVAPRANWQKGGHLLFFVWGRGGGVRCLSHLYCIRPFSRLQTQRPRACANCDRWPQNPGVLTVTP